MRVATYFKEIRSNEILICLIIIYLLTYFLVKQCF